MTWDVAIIGAGYVGLPLAQTFADAGQRALLVDVLPEVVAGINRGESHIEDVASADLKAHVDAGLITATADYADAGKAHAVLIALPTPLTKQREPDMTYIEKTAEAITPRLRKGQLVVLESTTYPGTTREIVLPILEKSGLKVTSDFYLAFSPEREDPGRKDYSTKTIPKVVGGFDKDSLAAAVAIYELAIDTVVPVSTCEAAEAAKILENTYRCVNIALVNELKVLFDRMGIDVWEVIRAAASKPFGFTAFYPGPGLGGHCIPIDPFYLSWKAREFQFNTRFIDLAGELNIQMPYYVIGKLEEALRTRGKSIEGARVMLLGLAYKKDIDDPRESPAFKLLELLENKGAKCVYNDPHIPQFPNMRHYRHLKIKPVELSDKELASKDAVMIVTAHSAFDYEYIVRHSPLIVDTQNACGQLKQWSHKIVRA